MRSVQSVLSTLPNAAPEKLIYAACDVATLYEYNWLAFHVAYSGFLQKVISYNDVS